MSDVGHARVRPAVKAIAWKGACLKSMKLRLSYFSRVCNVCLVIFVIVRNITRPMYETE
jgi:hypothetical protein